MSSSSVAQPRLVPHPLRQLAAAAAPTKLLVNAMFRTFDPGYDPNQPSTKFAPLAGARVDMVISGTAVPIHCYTDAQGGLVDPGSAHPNKIPLITIADHLGETIHFEILGPKPLPTDPVGGPLKDLTAMKYPVGTKQEYFPIPKWSTANWIEPTVYLPPKGTPFTYSGSIKIVAGVGQLGAGRDFTVGCYIDAELSYMRGDGNKGAWPENIALIYYADSDQNAAAELSLRPHGQLRATIFNIQFGKAFEIDGLLTAKAIIKDKITPVAATVTLTPASNSQTVIIETIPGDYFGLPMIGSASRIELHRKQTTISYPTLINIGETCRLQYDAYKTNLEGSFQNLTMIEKQTLIFNWFLEYVAYRNLASRTYNVLFAQAFPNWDGMLPLNLAVDDGPGEAATGTTGITQTTIAHFGYLLQPRDDICIHEMGHALLDDPRYIANAGSETYFPCDGTSHSLAMYSHEFFAFQEGFPQFLASLFMDPERAYFFSAPIQWPCLFNLPLNPNGNAHNLLFGFNQPFQVPMPLNMLEESAGMVIEGCYAAALTSVWRHIWDTRSNKQGTVPKPQPWVQDIHGDGTLEISTSAGNPNYWLALPDVVQRFTNLIAAPLAAASSPVAPNGKLADRVSTRRFIDHLEANTKLPSAWAIDSWSNMRSLLSPFLVINEFYISTVILPGGASVDIARWYEYVFQYHFPVGADPLVLSTIANTVFAVNGIRIPPSFKVSLRQGNFTIATAVVNRPDEYSASIDFAPIDLTLVPPGTTGTFDLLLESGTPSNKQMLLKEVSVK